LHGVPQLPQLAESVMRSAHAIVQAICPEGHEQLPPEHVAPVKQAWPHLPQLSWSVLVSTHAPPHATESPRHVQGPSPQLSPPPSPGAWPSRPGPTSPLPDIEASDEPPASPFRSTLMTFVEEQLAATARTRATPNPTLPRADRSMDTRPMDPKIALRRDGHAHASRTSVRSPYRAHHVHEALE
jgi:hypothetical protein